MTYKKYYEEIYRYVNNIAITATCYSQDTADGFRHCCEELHIETPKETYRTIKKVFCRYYNRTWEMYRFQSVLLKALAQLRKEYETTNSNSLIFDAVETVLKNN